MRKLFSVFKSRWFISLLGVLAIALLIWFAGPFIAFAGHAPLAGQVARLVLIMVLLLAWGLNNLRVQMKANKASKEIAEGLVEQEQAAPVRRGAEAGEEVAVLKERFEEAMTVLRKSRGKKGGKQSLYDLPWYIIIGPPGSGKTTALVNSGLHFPLAERFGNEALRGVGGTRNCDWWFTDEAILLDTAGRYVTQDSDAAADSSAWAGFLGLLKKYRRRRPINGVLVAISVSDLLLLGDQERQEHVRAIRLRLQELRQHLGIRFPVYVMFTKCDLVAGFTEFFDDLGREDRAQVWGMTFPLKAPGEGGPVSAFREEFALLLGRLNDRLIARLGAERDPQRRGLMFGFPQQMSSLEDTLAEFLEDVFRPTRYEETPLLRGVYFTSGTQEGTPIDRVMGALARTFGLDQQLLTSYGGQGRSYFLTNLLRGVVFPEQALAGANRRFERQRAWLQRGAYALALLVTVGAALAWSTSFTRNEAGIASMQQAVAAYEKVAKKPVQPGTDFVSILPYLDSLRAATTVYGRYEKAGVPLSMGLGLYQGDKLGAGADAAYLRELNRLLATRVASWLAQQLSTNTDPDFRYEALKLYLMLADPERLDPRMLKLWMQVEWQRSLPNNVPAQGHLREHLAALIAGGIEPVQVNAGLVTSVRQALSQVPLAQLVFARLKREAAYDDKYPFRPSDVVGKAPDGVFVRASGTTLDKPIPGLFTYRGYFEVYQSESKKLVARMRKERWVLGMGGDQLSKAELEKLGDDLDKLYFDEYIRQWQGLLDDLRLRPMNSLREASHVAEVLSGPRSPMRALLQAVNRNTSLNKMPAGAAKLAQAAGALQLARNKIEQMLQSGASAAASKVQLPGAVVSKHFQEVNSLVRKQDGSAPPLDRLIDLISQDYGYLSAVAAASAPAPSATGVAQPPPPPPGSDVPQRLEIEAARAPQPVSTWLRQLAQGSRNMASAKVKRETQVALSEQRRQVLAKLNADWKNNVAPTCRSALDGRYPFVPDSQKEVTLADFGRMFAPQGVLDQFFNNNLKPYVDTTQATWRWQKANGISLGLPDGALAVFQRAQLIRETFFMDGGRMPSVKFALKPVSLDANVTAFLLELDGQQFTYRHGPTRAMSAQWPGSQGPGMARIVFEAASGARAAVSEDGPWAWFRLLDRYPIRRISADRLVVTFEVKGHKASWEIRANSVVNPFQMKELQQFRCPAGF